MSAALLYHEATKHHFDRFARSAGYLDWATQPDPFRRYADAALIPLSRDVIAGGLPYDSLYRPSATPSVFTDETIAEFLRCSMGLSAWKQHRNSRWALRVNPSSGNLHPTELYVVRDGQVCHYAPREHALEERCRLDRAAWDLVTAGRRGFLIALTSVLWREAWKYGERAFRYCQHDTGHALAAVRFAAALLGWRMTLLPPWSDEQIAGLLGLGRTDDFKGAEREEPECIAAVTDGDAGSWLDIDAGALVDTARTGVWHGRANALSPSRVHWPAIDEVAAATRAPGDFNVQQVVELDKRVLPATTVVREENVRARQVIIQRRSAVAFDGRSTLSRDRFISMLARTRPVGPPWDAITWPPQIHLLLFVHRVDGLTPGVYVYLRDPSVRDQLRAAMRTEFLWEPANSNDPDDFYLLLPFDVTWVANRVSCDQDIAGDGFFSLGMLAPLESAVRDRGDWFYRRLFWEAGMLGQVLYLEAEAAGVRATGIGCYYDDAVHEAAGLSGLAWQSLYHLAMGMPVEDDRLTTEPGYQWEK